jgi:heme o synthase
MLGMLSFVLYAFVYTPLKRYSTIAVAVGAIPGALPVLIGCTAYNGVLTSLSIGLFCIQFLWQFPHFWAIGYLAFDDYAKAGYKLLPTSEEGGIDKNVGLYAMIYTLLIIPVLLMLYFSGDMHIIAFIINMILTAVYGYYSLSFYKNMERKTGLALMFSSFFYMPLVLLILLLL